MLSGDHHVCSCSEEAILFCLQCTIQIWSSCAKTRAKIPATRDHVTEKLSDLSAEQLAAHHHMPCVKHSDCQAELYCTSHQVLICLLCASSTHHQCWQLKGIGDVATMKREELRTLVQRLVDRVTTVTAKISQFDMKMSDAQAMREKVKAALDDMQQALEAQQQKLNSGIQEREDGYLAEIKSSRLDLENLQAALSAHKASGERLVCSAPDSCLLVTLGRLTAVCWSHWGD